MILFKLISDQKTDLFGLTIEQPPAKSNAGKKQRILIHLQNLSEAILLTDFFK
jgi:hypothetical protein